MFGINMSSYLSLKNNSTTNYYLKMVKYDPHSLLMIYIYIYAAVMKYQNYPEATEVKYQNSRIVNRSLMIVILYSKTNKF